jgi:hypothetical protein
MGFPVMSVADVDARLTAPGSPFETDPRHKARAWLLCVAC